ncbi:hypothetical protein A2316_01010 [Candidatus Falkowbacteria bacterium RIFOXYB2_FULL_38_15]|uniref:SIR2-like domain-containing protein n=1 Tax=Candidatus Falkowbacteria bacterium RIFOXYA2_FULL_38_12 TaxID=1797993 RepID=A0A1F5S4J6_9BACT|nr:MAG: hypothetical protein A2257_02415 [Candidatus Falkowbacteria bacterium RIFOXYA2_FULL_38_12]OGF32770.1 MAG: hypothetical protein A2316_01010 [Candidatus Falkowbacteria bacterium RIFOXYB2_FULL_38_15]OGF42194.1 MAG: hypothetical protein A2555_02885 [Candidatus Falkowbacteria bacterium RIFOXYD2_FULL_39_16]
MNSSIVFIIGAGASKEANLPTGQELKKKISSLLDIRFKDFEDELVSGDRKIMEAFRLYVQQSETASKDINPYLRESWHIRDALPQAISIDNFLDNQRNNEKINLCGKLAIIRAILEAEGQSLLYFRKDGQMMSFSDLSETWYIPFFQLLTENCIKDSLKERFKSVTLIIFNYDRCVEYFLYYAIQNYYRLQQNEAAELMKAFNIYHPYGDVGTLPWGIGGEMEIDFGLDPNPLQLLNLANKIKTFTEGTDPTLSKILKIREQVRAADKLIFMGFAFHKLNMKLIKPSLDGRNKVTECFATAFKTSPSDKDIIREQIRDLYGSSSPIIRISDSSCSTFFKDFWRSLSY